MGGRSPPKGGCGGAKPPHGGVQGGRSPPGGGSRGPGPLVKTPQRAYQVCLLLCLCVCRSLRRFPCPLHERISAASVCAFLFTDTRAQKLMIVLRALQLTFRFHFRSCLFHQPRRAVSRSSHERRQLLQVTRESNPCIQIFFTVEMVEKTGASTLRDLNPRFFRPPTSR